MANPRKFSEKIALQKQKQADSTAEFERIMQEVHATRRDDPTQPLQQQQQQQTNHNATTTTTSATPTTAVSAAVKTSGGGSPEDTAGGGGGGSPTAYRESRGRSVGVGPMRRPSERKQDRSPYGSSTNTSTLGGGPLSNGPQQTNNIAYLSPPMDSSNWRRSNSDSALHQSLNMAEIGIGLGGGFAGMMAGDMHALQANYQQHNNHLTNHHHHHHHQQQQQQQQQQQHNHHQRSHSPNIGRSLSPQAQRRKGQQLLQQQQQQQHQQHQQQQQHHMQMQQQLQLQQQQQHMQQQQQHQAQQQHQQQQHFNAKFLNCNVAPPVNSLFKSLQEQAMTFANTGSLPDLTSVHYAAASPQHMQQQQTLSPVLSPHNNGRERDQSPSPFSPGGGGGGPPSPYQHQQAGSPTTAANTPTNVAAVAAAAQTTQTSPTSPHLSFTNLAVQSPGVVVDTASNFGQLPTLGASSSTGNLTDYRQPLNPPSPGSSPGLLTSGGGGGGISDLPTSAPASPIRHPQATIGGGGGNGGGLQTVTGGGYSEKHVQTFDRYSPAISSGGINVDSSTGYNNLNPSFHNHFEQFTLGDSNSSPEQQQHQLQQHYQQQQLQQQQHQNDFIALEFEDFMGGGANSQPFSHDGNGAVMQHKILDFNDITGLSSLGGVRGGSATNTDAGGPNNGNHSHNANNNNNLQNGRTMSQQQQQQQQQQQMVNNNSNNSASANSTTTNANNSRSGGGRLPANNNDAATNNTLRQQQQQQQDVLTSSPLPSPLGCLPSASSPLPIPMSTQSGHHHHHQQQQQQHHSQQQQHHQHHHHHNNQQQQQQHHQHPQLSLSTHHSPHQSNSPLSASSPVGIAVMSGAHSPVAIVNANSNSLMNHQQQQHHHQQQQQQQNFANTPTSANIPSIIFSDYSSNSDFPREIFDTLDLDLGQMDVAGLQMLSDQNAIMIADPSIEDSFRRDLN